MILSAALIVHCSRDLSCLVDEPNHTEMEKHRTDCIMAMVTVIQLAAESDSNSYLSEEVWLTPLLGVTLSLGAVIGCNKNKKINALLVINGANLDWIKKYLSHDDEICK
ncbi:hypothetical protein GOODEAATRI_024710 [Goodea atripinnis]|uniref:Uncharacterized protein n=1 Tax=Goodea atripinnis TaxID=208336 RepID=A0ABV0NXD5_9TELE